MPRLKKSQTLRVVPKTWKRWICGKFRYMLLCKIKLYTRYIFILLILIKNLRFYSNFSKKSKIDDVFRIHGPYGHSNNFFKNSLIGPLGFISNIGENQKKIRPLLWPSNLYLKWIFYSEFYCKSTSENHLQ